MKKNDNQIAILFVLCVTISLTAFTILGIFYKGETGSALKSLEPLETIEPIPSKQLMETTEPPTALETQPPEEPAYEEGSNQKTYIYLGTLLASKSNNEELTYYIQDHLGSNMKVINGMLEAQNNKYYAYGETETTGETENNYKYTGKELDDETGLYYYGARYYKPELGRFVQADALRGGIQDPGSLNRYTYVKNNPLKYIDPTGNDWEELKDLSRGIADGVVENIKNIPEAVNNIINDPSILADAPKNFYNAVRGCSREGNWGGFGTAQDAYSAGKSASTIFLTLGGILAGGAGGSVSVPLRTFSFSASGGSLALAPSISTVTVSTSGAAALGGATLAVAASTSGGGGPNPKSMSLNDLKQAVKNGKATFEQKRELLIRLSNSHNNKELIKILEKMGYTRRTRGSDSIFTSPEGNMVGKISKGYKRDPRGLRNFVHQVINDIKD